MRRRGMRRYARTTVIVHAKSGTSIRGVLVAEYPDVLVLAHAEHLGGENPVKLGGEQLFGWGNVDFVQTVEAAS